MSSFRNSAGFFNLCKSLTKFCVYRKLSWMLLFLMNALCALEIDNCSTTDAIVIYLAEVGSVMTGM